MPKTTPITASSSTSIAYISVLPKDVLLLIFTQYLTIIDFLNCSSVSKQWRAVTHEPFAMEKMRQLLKKSYLLPAEQKELTAAQKWASIARGCRTDCEIYVDVSGSMWLNYAHSTMQKLSPRLIKQVVTLALTLLNSVEKPKLFCFDDEIRNLPLTSNLERDLKRVVTYQGSTDIQFFETYLTEYQKLHCKQQQRAFFLISDLNFNLDESQKLIQSIEKIVNIIEKRKDLLLVFIEIKLTEHRDLFKQRLKTILIEPKTQIILVEDTLIGKKRKCDVLETISYEQ